MRVSRVLIVREEEQSAQDANGRFLPGSFCVGRTFAVCLSLPIRKVASPFQFAGQPGNLCCCPTDGARQDVLAAADVAATPEGEDDFAACVAQR